MPRTEIQQTYRIGIIEQLRLLSSKEAQLEYQSNVPIANVTSELFCGWADDFNVDQNLSERWFQAAFNEDELNAIKEFNLVLNGVCDEGPDLCIEQFVLTPEWTKLSTAASKALQAFD